MRLRLAVVVLASSAATAHAQSHVPLPPVNLGGSSFLDAPGGPGFVFQQTVAGIDEPGFVDVRGRSVANPGGVSAVTSLTLVGYMVPHSFFGAFWGVEVLVPAAHVDLWTSPGHATTTGIGDVILSPFVLELPETRILGASIFQRVDLDVVAPTGRYDAAAPVNVGSHVWSFNPYYAVTVIPSRAVEVSVRLHYLWNSANHAPSPPFGNASSVQPGQAFHTNVATSIAVAPLLRVGVAGYFLKQISAGRVDGVSLGNDSERVLGVGPGIFVGEPAERLLVNVYEEFLAENRPRGARVSVAFLKAW